MQGFPETFLIFYHSLKFVTFHITFHIAFHIAFHITIFFNYFELVSLFLHKLSLTLQPNRKTTCSLSALFSISSVVHGEHIANFVPYVGRIVEK